MKQHDHNSELSPLVKTPWDKGDRLTHKPAWSPDRVAHALRGIDFKDTIEFKKSHRNGLQAAYVTRIFKCGCTAFEDRGWLPCQDALHNALAFDVPKSILALRLEQQRDKFDRVLAHAWSIAEHTPNDVDTRPQYGISASKYVEMYDLADREVVQIHNFPYIAVAELNAVPGVRQLSLYNAGNAAHIDLTLMLSLQEPNPDVDAATTFQPSDVDAATQLMPNAKDVNVTDMSADGIIAMIERHRTS